MIYVPSLTSADEQQTNTQLIRQNTLVKRSLNGKTNLLIKP